MLMTYTYQQNKRSEASINGGSRTSPRVWVRTFTSIPRSSDKFQVLPMENVPFVFHFDLCMNPVLASVTVRVGRTEVRPGEMECGGFDRGHVPVSMVYLGFGWPSSPSSTVLRWATYLSGGPPAAFRRSRAVEIILCLASS